MLTTIGQIKAMWLMGAMLSFPRRKHGPMQGVQDDALLYDDPTPGDNFPHVSF